MNPRLRVAVAHAGGRILVTDSLTFCDENVSIRDVVVAGSFAGTPAFGLAYECGVRAIVAHAAGVGKDGAGISGLDDAGRRGIAAAAVETMSARIGDGESLWTTGVIGHANGPARRLGVMIGMPAADAARQLLVAPPGRAVPGVVDRTQRVALDRPDGRAMLMMSTSFASSENVRDVVIAGSHGGRVNMLGIVTTPPRAVLAFDGGMSLDNAGISGLVWLDDFTIPAAGISVDSARIGDPASAWETGTLSFVNGAASARGVRRGMSVRDATTTLLATAV